MSWALARATRSLGATFRDDWAATPGPARVRWAVTLAAGALITAAVVAALTLLARGNDRLIAWDHRTLRWVIDHSFSFDVAIWWEAYGASSLLIPLVLLCVVLAIRSHRPLLACTFAISYLAAKPLVLLGWNLWERPRPDLVAGGIAAPPLNSFPSGHAFQAAAIYGLLAWLWIRRSGSAVERLLAVTLCVALLAVVSTARMRLGTHWPSDIAAGVIGGGVWLATLALALRKAAAAGGR